MAIEFHATYRAGVIHPDQPLGLPDNTEVNVVVMPVVKAAEPLSREEIIAMRPSSPKITPEEFDALLDKYSVSVGSLPADFSREDIYQDDD